MLTGYYVTRRTLSVITMKFLALSDCHGEYSRISQILFKAGPVDAVCVLGDITDFGPNNLVFELISIIGNEAPILMIPGNCDLPTIIETIDESSAVNLHLMSFDYNDIKFIGLGGSNPTPFNTPFEMTEEEIETYMRELLGEVSNGTVLLSHTPPKGFLDEVQGHNVGSEAVGNAVGIVDVIACGHIHEQRGVVRSGKTTIVNPGMAARGYGAVIEIVPGELPRVTLIQT